ncbi:HIT domain-containing protein [Cytophagaceae bacterium ABcell3]|nr:HIT domain-containing protein [Cytophagaceae bacterium ABcell3]
MVSCPFCNVSENDAFFSSSNFLAIYNLAPILPGHSLIIPRKHKESLFELSDDELGEFMKLGRDVAKILSYELNTDAFDWTIQEKEAAGQTVPHLHLHVIPRRLNDLPSPGDWFQELEKSKAEDSRKRKKLSCDQLSAITKRLKGVAEGLKKK